MNKNIFRALILLSVFLIMLVSTTFVGAVGSNDVQHQSVSTPTAIPQLISTTNTGLDSSNTITFDELGLPDVVMDGPYDSMSVVFSLPSNWQLLDGSEIQLIVSTVVVSEVPLTDNQYVGSSLDISVNNEIIASVLLEHGSEKVYNIRIPVEALDPTESDGRYTLFIFLSAGIDCDYEFHKTTVEIDSSSKLVLPHAEKSIPLDLGKIPQPIYKRNSVMTDPVAIVVPENPSIGELRSALITSAGFARMTNGELDISLISTAQLTEQVRENYHLIFAGKPSGFGLILPFDWPATTSGGELSTGGMQPDDGLLQMIVSPWNTGRVLIWIGGNSDLGVVKAAQALATGAAKPVFERNKILVADTLPFVEAANATLETETDYTLADLGYGVETISGTGVGEIVYDFYVTPGLIPSENPYLDLKYNVSSFINFSASGIFVLVNDAQVASFSFEEDETFVERRVIIPKNLIHAGNNEIRVQALLAPLDECAADRTSLALTVYPESVLYLPLEPAPAIASTAKSLADYPDAFVTYPDLRNVAFVLPAGDFGAWNVAAQIAFDLGSRVQGALLDFDTFFDGQIPDDMRSSFNFFIVGIPNGLSSISELNEELPIPFEENNSLPVIQGENIVYRVPGDISMGYLEMFPSPWGQGQSILTVLGSNAQGLAWAGNGLTDPEERSTLFGNFSVIVEQEVISADTRTGAGLAQVTSGISPVVTPEVLTQPTELAPAIEPTALEKLLTRKDYIPYAVGSMVLIIIVVLIFGIRSSTKK